MNISVPKNFHLTHKGFCFPGRANRFLNQLKQLHPDWGISIYNDVDCRRIVKEKMPGILNFYDSFPNNIQRADLFRVIILYLQGGFYVDTDVWAIKNIDELVNSRLVLGVEKEIASNSLVEVEKKHSIRIANYMFGSIPMHQFWLDVIKGCVNNSLNTSDEDSILDTTGPGLVTNVYHDQKYKYSDITLIPNENKYCSKKCCNIPSCHFGEYAAHLHFGTWRRKIKKSKTTDFTNEMKTLTIQYLSELTYDNK